MAFDPDVRPRDHFTPRRGWLNDPNGLIVHDGEHHLFFQHDPEGVVHGPMSWGHAVSTDLVTWTELPVALPSSPDQHVWSGSVVHDATDSSGLGQAGTGPLVAVFTSRDPATGAQVQCLASSGDRGRTWEFYPHNPVLDIGASDFRDPNVFRHGDAWVMVVVLAVERTVELYRSSDLVHWEHASSFGPTGCVDGVWECPDLVRVPVEGTTEHAWVVLVSVLEGAPGGGSGTQYVVGDFDGHAFTATQPARWVDHGADFYAAVSYADHPGEEPVVQAWMSSWQYAQEVPATDHRGSMTLARALRLRRRGSELVLVQSPYVRPGAETYAVEDLTISGEVRLPVRARTFRLVAEVDAGTADRVGLHVRVGPDERTTVLVEASAGTVSVDRRRSGEVGFHAAFPAVHTAPLPSATGPLRLEVVVDVASVEVFAADGEVALTDLVFPDPDSTGIAMFADGGTAVVRHLTVVE